MSMNGISNHPDTTIFIGYAGGYGNARISYDYPESNWKLETRIDTVAMGREYEEPWKEHETRFSDPVIAILHVAKNELSWTVENVINFEMEVSK